MKQTLTYFLVGIISLMWFILPATLVIWQGFIFYENHTKKFSENELIEMTLSKDTFNKHLLSNKKEITLNNHLYDIVHIKELNDNTIMIKLYKDDKEKETIQWLHKIFRLLKYLFSEISALQFNVPLHHQFFQVFIKNICLVIYSENFHVSPLLEHISPPPKV